ncbi:acyl-coenzyme A thioesterase 1-like [Poecilia formosa]|nr:PREDICTED: acyl-coenzyme A thioesterase 1-like [Poecilia formosa]
MSLSSPPPILSVRPSRALVDEAFEVLVENLPPVSPFTLRSLHHSEDGDDWEAYGHYFSDHSGRVSVSEDLSFGGTYSGREPMGLIWSLRPVPGSRTGLRLRKKDVTTPMLITISLYNGHEDFRDNSPLVSMVTERWYMGPGIQRIEITDGGLRGGLFIPPGPGPFPGILDLWGGGGGLLEYRSALLASRGYICLALEYFKTGQMKSTDLSFEYFEKAYHVLKDHPQVIPDRVGIISLCLGTIVTLSLVVESAEIKPSCVVCISNMITKSPGKTLSGFHRSIPSKFNKIRVDENNHQIWRDVGLALLKEPSMKVDVAKINCPLMLVNGCDDQNWCAVETADDISKTMNAAGKGHLLTRVDYPDTGHLIEPPFSPHCFAGNFFVYSSNEKVIQLYGGKTKPHSDAQDDSWRKILSFLRHHLYCSHKAKM